MYFHLCSIFIVIFSVDNMNWETLYKVKRIKMTYVWYVNASLNTTRIPYDIVWQHGK